MELVVYKSAVGGMAGTRTGMPADVRMIASSVGENNKSDDAFAASNLRFVMLERASGSPSSIFIGVGVPALGGVDGWSIKLRARS